MRMAISPRLRARSLFIEGEGSILQRLLDALGQHVHEALRIEAIHAARNLAAFVHDDGRGDGIDLQHAREAEGHTLAAKSALSLVQALERDEKELRERFAMDRKVERA